MAHVTSTGVGLYAASELHVLHRDRMKRSAGEIGLVNAHGYGATGLIGLDPNFAPPVWRFCGAGRPAISADLGGTAAWANATSEARVNDAVAYMRAQTAAHATRVVLLGASMGAATVLNWARTHVSQVAAIALLIPALDLEDIRDNDRGGLAASMNSAYGGASAFDTAMATRNPFDAAATLSGIPIKAWYASDDPICRPERVTSFIAAAGPQASAVNMGAVGHDATQANSADVASFLLQHA